MKRIQKFIKKNWAFLIVFVIGIIITAASTFYAAETIFASNQVSYDNSNSTLTSTNVQDALDELYAKAMYAPGPIEMEYTAPSGCTTPPFNLGDYITYTPTSTSFSIAPSLTGYTSVQTINPSELTLWRVIKKNECNVELVSEYVSSNSLYFRGTLGYRNLVGTLNIIATSYENPTYTERSRMMGYDGQTEFINDTSAFDGSKDTAPSTTSTPSPYTGVGQEYNGGVLGDTLYLKDIQLVGNVYKTDTTKYGTYGLKAYKVNETTRSEDYCIASRRFYYKSATNFMFYTRSVSSGELDKSWYFLPPISFYNNSWTNDTSFCAIRPIIILKSGIQISGGSGTITNPYTITA